MSYSEKNIYNLLLSINFYLFIDFLGTLSLPLGHFGDDQLALALLDRLLGLFHLLVDLRYHLVVFQRLLLVRIFLKIKYFSHLLSKKCKIDNEKPTINLVLSQLYPDTRIAYSMFSLRLLSCTCWPLKIKIKIRKLKIIILLFLLWRHINVERVLFGDVPLQDTLLRLILNEIIYKNLGIRSFLKKRTFWKQRSSPRTSPSAISSRSITSSARFHCRCCAADVEACAIFLVINYQSIKIIWNWIFIIYFNCKLARLIEKRMRHKQKIKIIFSFL